MYEFHPRFWVMDERSIESRACTEGWLIERMGNDAESRLGCDPPRYLQIGTGQWCGAPYATLFPQQSAANAYAKEFGYEVGRNVRLVWHRKSGEHE